MGEGKTGFDLGKGKRFKYDREVSTALLTTAEAKGGIQKLRWEKLYPKNTKGVGWGGVSDAQKTQLFPQ